MHNHSIANGYTPREAIAHLNHSLEQTLDQNRSFLEETARFTQDESLHMMRKQMEHADNAFAQLRERRDFGGLIDAQQEWFKQVMQDYAALSLRTAEMFHGLTLQVQSHVKAVAEEIQPRTEDAMKDLGQVQKDMAHVVAGMNGEQPVQ
jgi:gas vesicle protein